MINKQHNFINLFRALAAFWVVTAHSMIWGGWHELPIPNPKIAVDLFMIISGYLMMVQTFIRKEKEPMSEYKSWFRFWLRRFFRIAPAYYLSLLVAIITSSYFLSGYQELQNMNFERWENLLVYDPSRIHYDFNNILLHISFLFGLDPQYSFSTFLPDWSLSLEMQFYFLFPFIFLFIKKWEIKRSLLFLGFVSITIAWIINKFLFFYEPSFLALKLQYFLVGIILYYLLNHQLLIKDKILLALIALFLLLVEHRFRSYSASILFLMMFIMGWLEINKKLPKILFNILHSKFINFMSDSSYSVYLFHGFFISLSGLIISNIDLLKESSLFVHTILIWFIVVIFTYPLRYFLFVSVEKKGINYGRNLINKKFPILKRAVND